jgi:hypothetical protein
VIGVVMTAIEVVEQENQTFFATLDTGSYNTITSGRLVQVTGKSPIFYGENNHKLIISHREGGGQECSYVACQDISTEWEVYLTNRAGP